MISTIYCHQEHDLFLSPLTGHAILVNSSSEKHLLPPDDLFSARAVQDVAKFFMKKMVDKSPPFSMATNRDCDLMAKLSKVNSINEYALVLDEITIDFDANHRPAPLIDNPGLENTGSHGNKGGAKANLRTPSAAFTRMSSVLLRLWSIDQLGLCPRWCQLTRHFCQISKDSCGKKHSMMEVIAPSLEILPNAMVVNRMDSMLFRFAACSIGISHVDDIVPGAVPKHVLSMMNRSFSQLLKIIRVNQCLRHDPILVPQTPLWHGKAGKSKTGDHKLDWAGPQYYCQLAVWHSNLAEWISKRSSPGPGTRCAEFILNYLIEFSEVARTPHEFMSRSYSNPYPITTRLSDKLKTPVSHMAVTNLCHEFFDWLLIEKLSALNDLGRPIPSPDHWNPIGRIASAPKPVQTHREAIPTRFIKEMVQIITEDDWAWPKTIDLDYFSHHDSATGVWSRIWCPVRATAMLLKLLLPLRTYQVCMLDSGELDDEIYSDGGWTANASTLAIARRKAGVLRKFVDHTTGRFNTGFFINTNKTADRGKDTKAIGYEIPWQHEPAIHALGNLAAWQTKFNPLAKPQQWSDIRDKNTLMVLSEESLAMRGEIAFLFRDPTGKFVNDPLSSSRVKTLWILLLKELELRVARRGEAMPDGSPIRFVASEPKSATGKKQHTPLYDLHSLRVSIITSLATEGGVPIPILSKCIAGHASILMTLYYVKVGASMVNEELALAQKRIDDNEQANFKRFIFERESKSFKPFVLTNDDAGFSALEQKNAHLWSLSDKGVCPVGGALCHIGGPKTTSNTSVGDYAPVPGGPLNCVRCRFFVTGPAFLGGLVAHFNAVGIELMEASDRHRKKEEAIQQLEDELYELGGNDAELLEKIKLAQDRQEEDMKEVDAIASNWHAVYAFIERSKAIISRQRAESETKTVEFKPAKKGKGSSQPVDAHSKAPAALPDELSLVLGGDEADFGVIMQEATRFEAFNSVCQMAVAYPAEKAIPIANLRRSKLLDAMLSRNGCKPVFATLSDEEAMAVGNQLSTLLLAKLGRVEAANLIEGRRMLEGSGIFKDVQTMIQSHSELGFLPASATIQPISPKALAKPKKPIKNAKDST